MLKKSSTRRKSRLFLAFCALSIAGCVFSALATLYYDITLKMNKELKAYGANVIITPRDKDKNDDMGETEAAETIRTLNKARLTGYAPYLFTIGEVDSRRVVLVGGWFDQIKKVNPYWDLRGEWIEERADHKSVLVGGQAAQKLKLEIGQAIKISDVTTSRSADVIIKGIIMTGGPEEQQVFANLSLVQELSGRKGKVNIVYLSVTGQMKELERIIKETNAGDSGAAVDLVRRISRAEGLIIDKIKLFLLLVTAVILFSTLLCVAATMTAVTLERRKEIGLKKALGAENKNILIEFLVEAGVLGVAAGLFGYMTGFMVVQVIGLSVFGSTISFRGPVLPATLFVLAALSCFASLFPIKMAQKMEPAVVLRGE